MEYEILILVRTGEIVSAHPKGHVWKSGELEHIFTIIPFTGEQKDIDELHSGDYIYDGHMIIHRKTGLEFMSALTKQDAPPFQQVIETVATELDPDWSSKFGGDVCKFYQPSYLPFSDKENFKETRRYWFDKFYKFKDLDGMKEFLAAILYRDYGNIAEASRVLSRELKDKFLISNIFTAEDKI